MEKSTHTSEYSLLRSELSALRQAAGLTQRELAERLKTTQSWVAKVEMGERRIDLVEFCWFVSACVAEPLPVIAKLVEELGKQRFTRRRKKS